MTAGQPDQESDKVVEASARRRRAALAGHGGDEPSARALLADDAPSVRATALAALARMGRLDPADLAAALADPDPTVRRRAAELAAAAADTTAGTTATGEVDLLPLLTDGDNTVAEMAAWALGEQGRTDQAALDGLIAMATGHSDALCREAAVAALGAVGDERGLPAILQATSDKPAVRRRAVLALAPFDGPDVDAALRRALEDRDWQVRQAAEDLLADD
jgi:HEAT repeat protein